MTVFQRRRIITSSSTCECGSVRHVVVTWFLSHYYVSHKLQQDRSAVHRHTGGLLTLRSLHVVVVLLSPHVVDHVTWPEALGAVCVSQGDGWRAVWRHCSQRILQWSWRQVWAHLLSSCPPGVYAPPRPLSSSPLTLEQFDVNLSVWPLCAVTVSSRFWRRCYTVTRWAWSIETWRYLCVCLCHSLLIRLKPATLLINLSPFPVWFSTAAGTR